MNRPVRQQVQPRGYKPTFAAFLADRGTRKPSTPTMKAYRHDFDTIAERIVGSDEGVKAMSLSNITTEAMRTAFAQYAEITKRPPSSDAGRRGTCCAASPSPSLPVRRRLHGTRGSPDSHDADRLFGRQVVYLQRICSDLSGIASASLDGDVRKQVLSCDGTS